MAQSSPRSAATDALGEFAPPTKQGPWHDAGALLSWGAVVLAAIAQLIGEGAAIAAGLVFFLAGLAHGAGDENGGRMARFSLVFAAAYLLVGLAIAAGFLLAPLAGLSLFLALSAWHFARSDNRMAAEARFAIAGLATGGSALLRPDTTREVFSLVIGQEVPSAWFLLVTLAGVFGVIAALAASAKSRRGFGHALVALLSVALLHPVLAVGVIFLTAHAIPIQQRQIAEHGAPRVWQAVALPTAVATLGAVAIALAVWVGWLDLEVAIALAFGLATPHMLTERLEA